MNSDMIPELNGKTIGFIGFGYIGQLVAQKFSRFQVNILVFDTYIKDTSV
jgi:D-3-phosphoglycerate dehydrogenase